jgi:GNAT superfamily N-acetyltransferase
MASIDDALATEVLESAQVAAALELSTEAGWNQTAEDWRIFLAHGRVTGVFAAGRRLVATAAILPYAAFGYIAMVLVTKTFRHRGIATRLMRDAAAALRAQGRVPVLDATPAGAAVYRPLGFRELFSMQRWQGEGGQDGRGGRGEGGRDGTARSAAPRQATAADAPMLTGLDAEAFGAPRPFLMQNFLARLGTRAFVGDGGFVVRRSGLRADQIGPLVARDEASAANLLAAALDAAAGPVFIDLLAGRDDLTRMLSRRGFEIQRPFTRMALARSAAFGDPARLFAAAGPEFG